MSLPTISTPQRNLTSVLVGNVTYWFSYTTCVAFEVGFSGPVVSENIWSQTTGKHLNAIDQGDKKSRLPYPQFLVRLKEVSNAPTP